MDNIFIERLWRSIKYEEVHLKAYADARARAGIGSWMTFYNFRRPHQAMNNQMPMAVWRAGMDKIEAAARARGLWIGRFALRKNHRSRQTKAPSVKFNPLVLTFAMPLPAPIWFVAAFIPMVAWRVAAARLPSPAIGPSFFLSG